MSLINFLRIPTKLFKKDVITFLIIRRYDLGIFDDNLRYIAVRPAASVLRLRQKIWHLLDLPDYCDEVIILKTDEDREMPLTALCKGNDPQHPYTLEVWLPGKQSEKHKSVVATSIRNNMITMGDNETADDNITSTDGFQEKINRECEGKPIGNVSYTLVTNEKIALNTLRVMENQKNVQKLIRSEYKKSDLSCKISSSSIFFKLHGRKSRDNFANILLKIQSDLSNLNNKLSDLENRIRV